METQQISTWLSYRTQVAQNNLARLLGNVNRKENLPIKTLLSSQKMQSVNQISAQIKLTEIWKAVNQPKYPIKVTKQSTTPNARTTRGVTSGKLMETGSSNQSLNSFLGNATGSGTRHQTQSRNESPYLQ